jgi:hypothetical protein
MVWVCFTEASSHTASLDLSNVIAVSVISPEHYAEVAVNSKGIYSIEWAVLYDTNRVPAVPVDTAGVTSSFFVIHLCKEMPLQLFLDHQDKTSVD